MTSFLNEVRVFLDRNAKLLPPKEAQVWGVGDDNVSNFEERNSAAELEWVAVARAWKKLEYENGLGWIMGPKKYGGRELTADEERAYRELRALYDAPNLGCYGISLGMVGPTIYTRGNDILREKYLVPLYRGDIIGCQLFSEPGAGSDLASAQLRAERDGDEWVLNGQKVWTSGGHYSAIGLALTRTDPSLPKHKGLSVFIVDMKAPGVEVRPLRQMTGGAGFNEVFFTDVRIPDDHRVGDVNDGWSVALTTLMGERALGAGPGVFGIERAVERLLLMATVNGFGGADLIVRQKLAKIYSDATILRWQGLQADERRRAGLPPGPQESAFKLMNTELMRKISDLAGLMLGVKAIADDGEWGTFAWSKQIVAVPGVRIAAGTDEVMRNILGERVLGLPKEPSTVK